MCALSSVCKICPSFSHVTRGSGTPPTSHFMVTAPPSVATWSSSPWDRAMYGGTVKKNVILWGDIMTYWLSLKGTKCHYGKKKERMRNSGTFLIKFSDISNHKILGEKTSEICSTYYIIISAFICNMLLWYLLNFILSSCQKKSQNFLIDSFHVKFMYSTIFFTMDL